jgi:hypothetical protein
MLEIILTAHHLTTGVLHSGMNDIAGAASQNMNGAGDDDCQPSYVVF